MRLFPLPPADRQLAPVRALCPICGGELYGGELVYALDGEAICPDCLEEYARRRFASRLLPLETLLARDAESHCHRRYPHEID